MEIRDADATDVPDIRHVAERSWHEAYDAIIGRDAVAATVDDWYDPEDLRESVDRSSGHFLVADRNGTVVGYAQAQPSTEPWGDAFVPRLYVDPCHWGDGIGTALFEELCGRLRADGHERVWLTVLEDNDVGVSFYEGHGFSVVRERATDMAGHTVDEYVMARDL